MDPNVVRIIGNTGKEGKGENQFSQPRGICMDAKTKEVFIVDCNNHRIQVYHLSSLAFIRQIGKGIQGNSPGSLNYAVGICMDESNYLYVADTNNHRVVVFNRITGGHVRNIGTHGTAVGCLYSPYGVCVDIYTGILYVADYDNHRVQAYNKSTGEFIRVIGTGRGSGPGQMKQPIVVCIDYEQSYLLVADYSNNRVNVFDKDTGNFVRNIGSSDSANVSARFKGPRGLCISKETGILFVADRENHRIQLYDKNTFEFIRSIGGTMGISPGEFNRPMEICVNIEAGVLLVVDGYNHRVQVLEVPELQIESRKIRALMRSRKETDLRLKNQPRPSLLAMCTYLIGSAAAAAAAASNASGATSPDKAAGHGALFSVTPTLSSSLPGLEVIAWDPISRLARICFTGLGPLFDVTVGERDLAVLLPHLQRCASSSSSSSSAVASNGHRTTRNLPDGSDSGSGSGDNGGNTSDSALHQQSANPLTEVDRQADMFLAILESLCSGSSNSFSCGNDFAFSNSLNRNFFVAPALFALHSLADRGWRPSHLSANVISLLTNLLSSIDSGITGNCLILVFNLQFCAVFVERMFMLSLLLYCIRFLR
jgi:DNA-binding beta-propeller fold protein YncE